MFAICDSVQESLGSTPNELVFGHRVRGPLALLREKCLEEGASGKESIVSYIQRVKNRLHEAMSVAHENLEQAQQGMKTWYDRRSLNRTFRVGDVVRVLLPTPGDPLQAAFTGPCKVLKVLDRANYIVSTPMRRKKTQLCHANMLAEYNARKADSTQSGAGVWHCSELCYVACGVRSQRVG